MLSDSRDIRKTVQFSIPEDFTRGYLQNEHDTGISVEIHRLRHRWYPLDQQNLRYRFTWEDCGPYISVEASVHKMMLGHNVTGGPLNFQPAAAWFVDHISDLLDISLPHCLEWEVRRVDWAENYILPPQAISAFIESEALCKYGRRKIEAYGSESVHCPGKTAVKAYHKGPELRNHDGPRLRRQISQEELERLGDIANHTLRVESTIRAGKLRNVLELRHRNPLVWDICDGIFQDIHNEIVFRVFREGGMSDRTVVRHSADVLERLKDVYPKRMARNLYKTWLALAELGESGVSGRMKDATYYKHRSMLVRAGCAWIGAGAGLHRSLFPEGFSLSLTSPNRVVDEDPIVEAMLEPYRGFD